MHDRCAARESIALRFGSCFASHHENGSSFRPRSPRLYAVSLGSLAAPMSYDPIAALAALTRGGVRFVVIGGLAGRFWGSPTVTSDVDICYEREPENLQRLAEVLVALGARLRGVDDDVPFLLDAATIQEGLNFTFTTSFGPLDILGMPAGVRGYDDLERNAVACDLGDGVVVRMCDLDDLIRMKEAAGRPKDRIELEVLAAVREEQEQQQEHR